MLIDTITLYLPKGIITSKKLKGQWRNGRFICNYGFAQLILVKKLHHTHTYIKCSLAKLMNGKNYGIEFDHIILSNAITKLVMAFSGKDIIFNIQNAEFKRIDITQDMLTGVPFENIKKALSFLTISYQSKNHGMYNNKEFSSIYFQNRSKTLIVYDKTRKENIGKYATFVHKLVRFELRLKNKKLIQRKFGKITVSDISSNPEYFLFLCNKILKDELFRMFKPILIYKNNEENYDKVKSIVNRFGEMYYTINHDINTHLIPPYEEKIKYIIEKNTKRKLNFCYTSKDAFHRLLKLKKININSILKYLGLLWIYDNYDYVETIISYQRPDLLKSLQNNKKKIAACSFAHHKQLNYLFYDLNVFFKENNHDVQ